MKSIITAFDIHYPYQDKKSIDILTDITEDLQPDTFILGGDSLDFNCISFFNNGKPRRVANQTLGKDYKGFQMNILDKIENVLPSNCKKVFIKGNHENRIEIYKDYYPNVADGIIEIENNLNLDDWKIIEYNNYYKINKDTIILHGIYHNEYHSKKHLDTYGCNVYYGHNHNYSVYSRQTPVDKTPKRAISIGCLCNLNPHYRKDMPNNWIKQILILYNENGKLYDNIVTIHNGKTIFNGKLYG